ncbi:uncharacterized protein LOC129242820 [Anastrepha obliqua]|uniref:uncharacterized protein LOC129242820 n=1 Tax=Anastrepha obliqua TaxID=95512 RepID=UPI00240A2C1F|nr:uncharacterized protein LOC129242820 [Anastrepha obliqua]
MLFSPPKCMQQIATLIITFAVYVAGIRNTASTAGGGGSAVLVMGSSNVGAIADYESYSAPYNEDFRPSQLLSEVKEETSAPTSNNVQRRQSTGDNGNFRPSQIISFTPSDAQSTYKKYPPSYLEPNYHTQHNSKGSPYGSVSYGKEEKQFSFPHKKEQATAASAVVTTNTDIQKYLYTNAPSPSSTQQSLVPAQLHTTPILIYRDPYTNKINTSQRQHDYRPAPEPIYEVQYSEAGRPQEYTVQSMLVVGAEQQQPPTTYNQQRPGGEHKRPGYVFDEQLGASYNQRPVYSNRYEMVDSTVPTPPTSDYNRRDGDTQTERPFQGKLGVSPSTITKLSYDSHDYPPPSYYKQQTSNFQSPQRQEDNTPNYQQSAYATPPAPAAPTVTATTTMAAITFNRPELTSSNYANKFGNYLNGAGSGGKAGDLGGGYYKRPPPHYSNDILYVTPRPPAAPSAPVRPAPPYYPQGNEPIRRPPNYNNNYYEYQLGEIPPPSVQQSAVGSGQRPPPGQYYPTSPFYPETQNYPAPQSYPASQNYPPSQHYPPPPNYRPPPPQYQLQQPTAGGISGGMSGLATLASIFSGTQQYAPQFTNLLLGGNGGGGGLLHALTGTRPLGSGGRPPNMQLIKALENIARNDDLECVPKVLCNMIASQTQRGQLPNFITSPAITNFLAGFPAQSPALIYGRAALLGISGGERSCTQTYAKCPKNEYEILYYLNNHRGGFFKFFSESEEQKPSVSQQTHSSSSSSGGTSLFSLLSALTGADPPVTTTTPRPTPPPTLASFDITQGIGNFFSNILSEYISGVEYQRRSSRAKRAISFEDAPKNEKAHIKFPLDTDSEDFHDSEDEEDTHGVVDFEDEQATSESLASAEYGDTQGRVVFKSGEHNQHFFPENEGQIETERLKDIYLEEVINKFNADRLEKKLKFPTGADAQVEESAAYSESLDTQGDKVVRFRDENESYNSDVTNLRETEKPSNTVHFEAEHYKKPTRRTKTVLFKEPSESSGYDPTRQPREEVNAEYNEQNGERVIFPDHYDKHIRKGKILNRPILYASNYADYMQNADADHFVVSDSHRPVYNDIDATADDSDNFDGDKQLGPIYYSESSTHQQQHTTHHSTRLQVYGDNRLHYNRGADTYPSDNDNRYTQSSPSSSANYNKNRYSSSSSSENYKKRPSYAATSSGNRYDYPNKSYVSNNRYGSRYQTTTRSPRGSENDHNIYVTNAQGVTTHYITPDGRKVYL